MRYELQIANSLRPIASPCWSFGKMLLDKTMPVIEKVWSWRVFDEFKNMGLSIIMHIPMSEHADVIPLVEIFQGVKRGFLNWWA